MGTGVRCLGLAHEGVNPGARGHAGGHGCLRKTPPPGGARRAASEQYRHRMSPRVAITGCAEAGIG
jgi:hypothetical protein